MKKSLEREGINVFVVSNEKINLKGYNCGFIGGSGFILNNKLIFFGSITKEIYDNDDLISVLNSLNIEISSVFNGNLYDYGGVKILK
jgi:hypothetical protein